MAEFDWDFFIYEVVGNMTNQEKAELFKSVALYQQGLYLIVVKYVVFLVVTALLCYTAIKLTKTVWKKEVKK